MQAKTDARAAETASLLETFGIELSAGGLVVMTDFAKAESAYIHHSAAPVAVVAMAVASPTFARGRFPKLRLGQRWTAGRCARWRRYVEPTSMACRKAQAERQPLRRICSTSSPATS